MNKIILASASPRRKELIKLITDDFIIDSADIDETTPDNIENFKKPEYLALIKAREVSKKYPDDIVIGADTSVIIDNKILGKPKDKTDAYNMLKTLSDNSHFVVTGCAIVKNNKAESFSTVTKVNFLKLQEKQILDYISSNEPYDKAGGYAIQSTGALFVKSIEGDFYNVVGFPIAELNQRLIKYMNIKKENC